MRHVIRHRNGSRRRTAYLFDNGWNALRDTIFANQKRLGVVPQNAQLTPWPDKLLKRWDTLTPEEKKLFIRQAEVYAAYLMYADHEIGRVIQQVADMVKLDNTLIIYITWDNGASAEGTPNGTPSELLSFNGIELPVAEQMKWYEAWGTDKTHNHVRPAFSVYYLRCGAFNHNSARDRSPWLGRRLPVSSKSLVANRPRIVCFR